MRRIIKITLKSDICPASGYSYAGIIDRDACYDTYGLPYIPARRLKGCLREAAEMVGVETDALFGQPGQGVAERTALSIGNAYPEHYEALRDFLEKNRTQVAVKRVLNRYTMVKGQTRLEDGVAMKNTLRYTRIIRHYDPLNGGELCFYAPVEICAPSGISEEECCRLLTRCVKALRHIGYNRNRGLGNIKCELMEDNQQMEDQTSLQEASVESMGELELRYLIKTESPLIISQNSGTETDTYISGRIVQGFLASCYLKSGREADEAFEEMFLQNKVVFSPLYPSDEAGNRYVPAPEYLGRLKKTKYLVNTSVKEIPEDPSDSNASIRNGNQPKKLKKKYVNSEYDVKEVRTEVTYHNRHEDENSEVSLYTQEAISARQYFSGMLTGPSKMILELEKLLKGNRITLGKSLNAQYGRCSLVELAAGDTQQRKAADDGGICKEKRKIALRKGDEILVVLESDGIFIHDGHYTCRADETAEKIRKQVQEAAELAGGTCEQNLNVLEPDQYMEVVSKKITGYYGVWNLKRQAIPAVAAGSTFSYVMEEDAELPETLHLGENTGEGYGIARVMFRPQEWVLKKYEEPGRQKTDDMKSSETSESGGDGDTGNRNEASEFETIHAIYESQTDESVRKLLSAILLDIGLEMADEKASGVSQSRLSTSAVGRLTLMVTESENETRNTELSFKQVLDEKIDSMKDTKKQAEAAKFVKDYYTCNFTNGWLAPEDEEKVRRECLRKALIWLKYKAKEA